MRVGMIFMTDPDCPGQLSGMPWAMRQALLRRGLDVVPLRTNAAPRPARTTARVAGRIRSRLRRSTPPAVRRAIDAARPHRVRIDLEGRAAAMAGQLAPAIDREDPDVLFGVCISTAISRLETDRPIVYFSDATSPLLHATYPALAAQSTIRRTVLQELERSALARVDRAVFACPATRDSAVRDLGVPEDRATVVPMGAHVMLAHDGDDGAGGADAARGTRVDRPGPEPPRRDACELIIVAADPIRKRVDLAVDAVEILRRRGVDARLQVVGPGTRKAEASPAVRVLGRLRLEDAGDRARHVAALGRAHLNVLPSVGEAFGIAPAEAAHLGIPSIVSDVGGLPFVVRDGETGTVLPVSAGPEAWADAVLAMIGAPERYRAFSRSARRDAAARLTWDAWATALDRVLRRAAREHGAVPSASRRLRRSA